MPRQPNLPGRMVAGALFVALGCVAVGSAQRTGAPADVRPSLAPIIPLGAQRGTALDLILSGTNLADPRALGQISANYVTILPNLPAGKDSTKIRARLEVPPDAQLGWQRLRVLTDAGLSNFRPLCVDALPQFSGNATNHTLATAQAVPLPSVVVGRIDAETSDFYRITVAAGQRVSLEVIGRRMGSPLDPLLRFHDARSGRDLPRLSSDDAPGLQSDARLSHTFAEGGEYLIEVRDTTNKGGNDYWYRLRLGDFPCAITPWPLAAKRGTKVSVGFAGPQVDGVAPVEVQVSADPLVEAVSVTPVGPNGLPGWPVELLVSDHEEVLAGPSLQTPAEAQRLPVPCGVSGRFLRKSQRDHFVFAAKKDQRYTVSAQTTELHSPAEVYLTLRNAQGGEVAHSDPHREARIDVTAPADGDYFIVAEHLNYAFGPNEVYRLTLTPLVPSFELSLATDRVDVPQGFAALIPVQALLRRDYAGPIELSVVGPPELSGLVTIPANVQAPRPAAGQPVPPPVAHLPVRAAAELAPGAYEVHVRAKAVIDGREVVAYADVRAAVQRQMAGLPYPPRQWLRAVAVGVTPKPPFVLTARYEPPEAVRGLSTKLLVTATRDPGFDGAIELAADGLPPNVTAAGTTIAADQVAAALALQVDEKAGLGSFAFSVVGRARHGDRPALALALPPPLAVVLPFELKVEPNPVALDPGGRTKVTVTAVRKGGYDGPIALELRNLPGNVAADRATIGPGQTSAVLELTAAMTAPSGSRGDVDVLGTAPLGNQQASSAPFTVKVGVQVDK
jgi:hypothetical protein